MCDLCDLYDLYDVDHILTYLRCEAYGDFWTLVSPTGVRSLSPLHPPTQSKPAREWAFIPLIVALEPRNKIGQQCVSPYTVPVEQCLLPF